MQTTIYLLRHGEVHNPEQILYGRILGFRLSENGQRQAQAAGTYLAEQQLTAVYASPQQRAQETAGFIAAPHKLPVHTEDRLDETYTPFDGTPLVEMAARDWDLYTGTAAPYEQPDDILRRSLDFIAHARHKHSGQSIAVVTHGDIVVFTFMHYKGIFASIKDRMKLYQHGIQDEYPATASITRLVFDDDAADAWPQVSYMRPYSI
ncbi:MAG: histidine phosphatase family protein [Chloroflexota bacterium]